MSKTKTSLARDAFSSVNPPIKHIEHMSQRIFNVLKEEDEPIHWVMALRRAAQNIEQTYKPAKGGGVSWHAQKSYAISSDE